ncbi:MAG TPA: hypothetical protein VFR58_06270 [Flavisolibacter sp.]|nr:hypothetical protein [Flavisolibacter sp.]
MPSVFSKTKDVLLHLLLVLIGLFAGMLFFHEMCPVETKLSPIEYAKYWKIVDGSFMHERMKIVGPLMLVVFIINILVNLKDWKSRRFLLLLLSFGFMIADLVLAVSSQLPINEFINSLNMENISDSEMTRLQNAQLTAIDNFHYRLAFGLLCFAILCLVPFSKKPQRQLA